MKIRNIRKRIIEIRIKDEFTTGIELYSLRALLFCNILKQPTTTDAVISRLRALFFCNILKIVGVIILSRAVLIV